MYKVIPWDEDKEFTFDSFVAALQFGNINYGSRYDLIDLIDEV